jgi:hypothetical protein
MSLAQLLSEVDAMGLGLVTWKQDKAGGWACFAANVGVPCVAVGPTGRDALDELVRFAKAVR